MGSGWAYLHSEGDSLGTSVVREDAAHGRDPLERRDEKKVKGHMMRVGGWITADAVVLIYAIVSAQVQAGRFEKAAYARQFGYALCDQIEKLCPILATHGSLADFGRFPNHYSENDARWASYTRAGNRGKRDGTRAAKMLLTKAGVEAYCKRLLTDYGPSGEVFPGYIRAKTLEERAGLPAVTLEGCRTEQQIVVFGWACDPDPRAMPMVCAARKAQMAQEGDCRTDLRVLRSGLTVTGRTREEVPHEEFSGLKLSGPFVQLRDSKGALWWVDRAAWELATKKRIR